MKSLKEIRFFGWKVGIVWLLFPLHGVSQELGDHQYTTEAIQAGLRVYSRECALCHGPRGDLVSGINLRLGQFRNAQSDDDIRTVVLDGAAEGQMPAFNFNAEQFKVSNISSSIRSNLKNGVSIDANLTHDLYKFDDLTQTRINELDNFPRLTGIRLATNFTLRSKTNNPEEGPEKEFSDRTKEFLTDLSNNTWQSRIGLSYTVNKINPLNTIENFWVNTNTSVNVTQNWKLNYNARFSISDKDIVRHNITLYREIDCWELFMDWTPTGYAKGLYFRLNLKSDILKDLKVEQKTGLYNTRSSF